MKVLHVAASLNPAWGGPTKVVTELTEALAKKGIEVSIFAPLETNTDRPSIMTIPYMKIPVLRNRFRKVDIWF